MKKESLNHLKTDFEKNLTNTPYSEYPRPQFKREGYLTLNGWWNFKVEDKKGCVRIDGKILVPFAPESRISGVFDKILKGDTMIYRRDFKLEKGFNRGKVILHVDECDQYISVSLNGQKIGTGVGVLPHNFDITAYLQEENVIEIVAKDDLDKDIPYGKQTANRGGMWYTKTSGIKKSVWLESMPINHIESIKIDTDLTGANITVKGGEEEKKIILNGKEYSFSGERARIDIENPILWSPTNPHLYYFDIISGEDKVCSYFGLRKVSVGKINNRYAILLNNEPIFCHGLLDQGYYSDGIYLPATEKGFEFDVLKMKECGFNTLRKHIKLEPDVFYYYCDKYGMLVFQDMINNGGYSFLIDTAIPTVFTKRGITHRASKRRKEFFQKTSLGILDCLYNHPSVVYYTIFNEGWGQFNEEENYKLIKSADPSRVYDTTSGWFKKECTDVESDHVYFKKVKPKKTDKPWVLSEFGGYCYKIKENSFNLSKTFGYKFLNDKKQFNDALTSLYCDQIIPAIQNGLCGAILTQVSDVEDETNGLLTYDRKVVKVEVDQMKETAEKLNSTFKNAFSEKKAP